MQLTAVFIQIISIEIWLPNLNFLADVRFPAPVNRQL